MTNPSHTVFTLCFIELRFRIILIQSQILQVRLDQKAERMVEMEKTIVISSSSYSQYYQEDSKRFLGNRADVRAHGHD